MDVVTLAGLVKLELRSGTTVRWCDGGVTTHAGESYAAHHAVFGSIAAIEAMTDGIGDEVPALKLTLFPAVAAAAAELAVPGNQGSRLRLWIAEVALSTGAAVGADLVFDGLVDTIETISERGSRIVELAAVPNAERLFVANEGNTLSPRFHRLLWPGEAGEDNATGLGQQVAWGVARPVTGGSYGAGGGGGGFAENIIGSVRNV